MNREWIIASDYGASGSEKTVTGKIKKGSCVMQVESTEDFAAGQGITAEGCFFHTYGTIYNDKKPYLAANQKALKDEMEIEGIRNEKFHQVFLIHFWEENVYSWMAVDPKYQHGITYEPFYWNQWQWQGEKIPVTDGWVDLLDGVRIRFRKTTGWLKGSSISFHARNRLRAKIVKVERNKIPTMKTMKEMVRSLAALRYNSLQLYMEHTYAFSAHERVWAGYSPFTSEEIMELDSFCNEHFIELVPNLNSFGHLERWLRHAEYRDLAECNPPYIYPPTGTPMQGVLHPGRKALEFIDSLYREFLPNFTSRKLNIGCDETVELGKGKSAILCKKKGVTQVYVDFLSQLTEKAAEAGFRIEFWGDIILKQPEFIAKLPKGVTALAWGYEYNHPFKEQSEHFRAAGVEYLVCPGTSTWQTILGRTTNMIECIRNAMFYGSKNGARGLLMTDWGDCGHHQYYPVSWPGMAMGGGASWNADSKETEQRLPYAVSLAFAPGDEGIRLGRFLLEIGKVYDDFTTRVGNSTAFGRILPSYPGMKKSCGCFLSQMKVSEVKKARKHTEALLAELMRSPFRGHALVNAELENALKMALCAMTFLSRCLSSGKWEQAAWRDDLRQVIGRHEQLWLERNRIGGLYESSNFLRKALDFDPDDWKKR